jgi:hypothetical protein
LTIVLQNMLVPLRDAGKKSGECGGYPSGN